MTPEIQERAVKTITATPRIGLLGFGSFGKYRLEAIRGSGSGDVTVISDPLIENMERFCKDNDLKSLNNSEALFESDLQGIVVATPNKARKDQITKALQEGKAVFSQMPMGCTLEEALEIIRVAKENNCLLMNDHGYRHTHSLRKIKALIDSGEVGEIYAANFTYHNASGPEKSWYYDPALSGGGCMMDLGVTLIDSLYWLFPDVQIEQLNSNLYVRGQKLCDSKSQVEDFANTNITFTNGSTMQITCSWNLSIGKDAIIEMNFYGTKGGATFRNVNGSIYDFKAEHYKGTRRQVLSLPPDDWGGKDAAQWASHLANKNEYLHETDNYIKTAQMLDLIYGRFRK